MTNKPHSSDTIKKIQKVRRKSFFLMIFFVPIALLITSFSVIAVAQDNMSDQNVQYWINNRESLISDYQNDFLMNPLAGIIQFDKNNIVPIYNNIESAQEGASFFGATLPGESGRCIVMGHNEQDFVYLSKLEIGSEIIVDSYNGQYTYVVQSIEVVVPSEIPFDETEQSVLTLVSQYPFRSFNLANRRYVVEAIIEK